MTFFESRQSLEDVEHTYEMRIKLLTDELNKVKQDQERELNFLKEFHQQQLQQNITSGVASKSLTQLNNIGNNTLSTAVGANSTKDTVDDNLSFNSKSGPNFCSCKL